MTQASAAPPASIAANLDTLHLQTQLAEARVREAELAARLAEMQMQQARDALAIKHEHDLDSDKDEASTEGASSPAPSSTVALPILPEALAGLGAGPASRSGAALGMLVRIAFPSSFIRNVFLSDSLWLLIVDFLKTNCNFFSYFSRSSSALSPLSSHRPPHLHLVSWMLSRFHYRFLVLWTPSAMAGLAPRWMIALTSSGKT